MSAQSQRCPAHQKPEDPGEKICLTCKDLFIQALQDQVETWKDAWYKQREATGKMAWEVPPAGYVTPKS